MPPRTISIKDSVSEDLALRANARSFFERVEELSEDEVVLDFKDVKTITRSFAHEYLKRKDDSKKEISEVNVPSEVKKMFEVVGKASKPKFVDDSPAEVVEV